LFNPYIFSPITLVFIIPDAQLLTGVGEGLLSLVILETPEHKPSPNKTQQLHWLTQRYLIHLGPNHFGGLKAENTRTH